MKMKDKQRLLNLAVDIKRWREKRHLTAKDLLLALRLDENKDSWEELLEEMDDEYRDFRDDRASDDEL